MDFLNVFRKPTLIATISNKEVYDVDGRQGGTFLYMSQMYHYDRKVLAVLWAYIEQCAGGQHGLEGNPQALNALPYLTTQLNKGNLIIQKNGSDYQIFSKIPIEKLQKKLDELTLG